MNHTTGTARLNTAQNENLSIKKCVQSGVTVLLINSTSTQKNIVCSKLLQKIFIVGNKIFFLTV